jgi:hypothetical protein
MLNHPRGGRPRRSWCPEAIGLIFLLFSPALVADAPRPEGVVILLQPDAASPAARRSMARIRDELLADRFHVIEVDSTRAGEPGAIIEQDARDLGADNLVTFFGDPDTGHLELWVMERAGGLTAIRQAIVTVAEPERMPEVLSARTLELLRATALELSIKIARERQPLPAPDSVAAGQRGQSPAPSLSSGRGILTIDAGMAVVQSVAGPPTAVAPLGRVQVRLSDWLMARLSLTGLGTRPRVETANGSAELSQTIGLFELGVGFRNDQRIRPTLSLGAGLLSVGMVGSGKSPYEGREGRQQSAVFDAGLGGAVALRSRVALAVELHAFLASPHPEVRFLQTRAATIGYPSFVLLLALQVEP